MTAVTTHRTAEEIGRTATGPRPLPALGETREVALPDVVEQTLPSGLRVLAARRPGVPMVELRLRVPFAGSDADHPAVAELLSSTLLTGTADRDRVEIDDELAAVGADLGVSVDPERLSIGGSGLSDGLPRVLAVLADVLTAATHPDAEVARERERLAERIAVARAQPRTIAREALQRRRFGDHPITREMPRAEEVAAVTAEQVRALQAAALVPGGSILTLVGDIDPQAAIAHVGDALAGWTAGHDARELDPPPLPDPGDLLLVHRPGSVQSQLRLSGRALRRDDDGYAALQLANLVFGGYFSSRWMENIREDKGYTYGAHSGTEFVPGGALLGVETDVASDVTAAALLETRYELGRMTAVPPSADEVEAARAYAIGSLLISLDSQGGLAGMLTSLAADGLDVDWLRAHPGRLTAVTTEQVAAAALEFFAPSTFTGVVVGDAEVIGAGVRALGGIEGP
ncbi:peptidase M16 domain protein [Pseudonocardia dioxanivorans CB1190]|uniref:Peptidase M16 domain protein n=1 Tax=Pseudonocardia dioxanivorans (strain ATCC 55486 / DSM 44775 / JCM 13855 / CB1190) TaxID=675635 RepID=F4CSF7_PSEUX|nr:pitrilysin family protein [Pseudonocardia dioxanivorans]AEA23362.1 peptidase M16 domain protein [Pseudonocardia dioxanivorans CB1190]